MPASSTAASEAARDPDEGSRPFPLVFGRFDLKYAMGGLSHRALVANIELYGTRVVPRVRELPASPLAARGG
jgi:hypothetical protein